MESTHRGKIRTLCCRVLFILAGLAPLAGTLAFATWSRLQDHEQAITDWIVVHLGMDAVATEWREAQPRNATLAGLKLLDPESGQMMARCEGLRHRYGPGGHAVHIQTAYCADGQMATFWQMLDRHVLRQRRLLEKPFRVHIDRLVLRDDGAENELRDVRVECQVADKNALASITLRSSNMSAQQRSVRIWFRRGLDGDQPVTRIEVRSSDEALDVGLLTGFESLTRWGKSVSFQGMLWLESVSRPGSSPVWSGEVAGRVRNLQLADVTRPLPHKLSGVAEIEIRDATFEDSRLVTLDATAIAVTGTASQSWLAKINAMGLQSSQNAIRLASAQDHFEFDQLACHLQLSKAGLVIQGACDERGTLLHFGGSSLVQGAGDQIVSTETVIQSLTNLPLQRALVTPIGARLWRSLPLATP